MQNLSQEISQVRNDPTTTPTARRPGKTATAAKAGEPDAGQPGGPRPLLRTAVAILQSVEPFGWMVAAEAMARGFYDAPVRGLPVSSAAVESLVKQFNQRVKGTEKFWGRGGAEAILQCRAAYLSDDGRAEDFYARRPRGPAVGRNRRKLVA